MHRLKETFRVTIWEAFQGVVWCRLIARLRLFVGCFIGEKQSLSQRKERGIESELSLSQTVALFLAISVGCRCLGRRLSLIASNPWKALFDAWLSSRSKFDVSFFQFYFSNLLMPVGVTRQSAVFTLKVYHAEDLPQSEIFFCPIETNTIECDY